MQTMQDFYPKYQFKREFWLLISFLYTIFSRILSKCIWQAGLLDDFNSAHMWRVFYLNLLIFYCFFCSPECDFAGGRKLPAELPGGRWEQGHRLAKRICRFYLVFSIIFSPYCLNCFPVCYIFCDYYLLGILKISPT